MEERSPIQRGLDFANLASQSDSEGSRSRPRPLSSNGTVTPHRLSSEAEYSSHESDKGRGSPRRHVPGKVRRIFGRARDFRRVAAVRMQEANRPDMLAKGDGTPRSGSPASSIRVENRTGNDAKPVIPAFLRQSSRGELLKLAIETVTAI